MDNTNIHVEPEGDRLEIETDYDELGDNQKRLGLLGFASIGRPATDYTFKMPRASHLIVNTYSGTFRVRSR